jgi:hypothetical protein
MVQTLPQWADELAAAFRETGPDIVERSVFGKRAFLVEDSLVGTVELRSSRLAVRLRLDESTRAELEARAHFDPQSPIPTLLIVTEDDKEFALRLIPHAYRFAHAAERSTEQPTTAAAASPPRRRRTAR